MRIAVFIKSTTFHEGYGGLETQNKELCEGLVRRNHEVVVFSPQRELDFESRELNSVSYIFVPCSYRSLYGFAHVDRNNWFNKSVEFFSNSHNEKPFGIVIGQSSAALGIISNKQRLDIRVVSISHGTTMGEFKTRLQSLRTVKDYVRLIPDAAYVLMNFFTRQRKFILHSNKVIAVSGAVKRALIDETFVPESRVVIIHNGRDPKVFDSEEKGEVGTGIVKLIYVGRIIRSKGVLNFVALVKSLSDRNIRLSLLGDGEDAELLKKKVKEADLENVILLLGKLPYSGVVVELLGSDIFVLPSLRVEGFPMILVEAMFAGLPVVATDVGGVSDAIEDGETGFLVKLGDTSGFAEKLNLLINNDELRDKMGKNALIKARREFGVDVMLDKYEKVINEVCSENS